jgi:sugar phosphate isomerase/epimerase
LHDDGAAPAHALVQAREVIDLTRPLDPRAWVCHLDGRNVRDLPALSSASAPTHARWVEETALALQEVCAWAGSGARVAIENLEGYPPEFVTPVVARTSAGRCLDVGHLWLDGIDPLPHLAAALPRLQVIHLHGVRPAPETTIAGPAAALQDSRDHNSLAYADPGELDRVLAALLRARYTGILCLEVFGEDDFWSSLAALGAAVDRVCREGEAGPWAGI